MNKTIALIIGITLAIIIICVMFFGLIKFAENTGVRPSGPFLFVAILILWGVQNLVLRFFGYTKEAGERDKKYQDFTESKMSEKRQKGWLIFFIIFVALLCIGAFLVSIE